MKIVVAGFTTALLVFAIASAMLLMSDATQSGAAVTRRKASSENLEMESARPPRVATKHRRIDAATQELAELQSDNLQRKLSDVWHRESEVQAKQDALRMIFDEIRQEQQSVEFMRQQVSDEIAVLQDAAVQVARRDGVLSSEEPSTATSSQTADSRTVARPIVSIRDSQAVQDTAVLVNRLAQQGNIQTATSLLRSLKDRDATKVLTAISATDKRLALQLTEQLLATRDEKTSRR